MTAQARNLIFIAVWISMIFLDAYVDHTLPATHWAKNPCEIAIAIVIVTTMFWSWEDKK